MSEPKRIKAVLFDLDDTLISWEKAQVTSWRDFNRPKYDAIHAAVTAAGHTLPPKERFAAVVSEINKQSWEMAHETGRADSLEEVLVRSLVYCGLDRADIDGQLVIQAYPWAPLPGVAPYPDTHTVLDALQANGYQLGLITNAYQPMWMRDSELEHYDLLRYFPARITSGDTRFIKPHPAIYWRMLGMLNILPHEAVFVGDRPANDIKGALDIGMTAVWLNHAYLNFDLNGIVPDYTITTLSDLLPILEQLG